MKTTPIKGAEYLIMFSGDKAMDNGYNGHAVCSGKTEDFCGETNYGFYLDPGDGGECYFPLSSIFPWED